MIAIILQALWGLGRSALKTRFLGMVAITGVALSFLRIHELLILFGCGVGVALQAGIISRKRGPGLASFFAGSPLALASTGGVAGSVTTAVSFSLWPLFLFFLKVGSVLFGSGYVLLAFLRADLVERWHWLSESQLLDAIAIGQATPGPVFTTATFIGYVLGGAPGAAVATLGIFLPAFLFVAVSGPLVPRLRRSLTAGAFLDGVNAASLALMTVVTWQLAKSYLGGYDECSFAGVKPDPACEYSLQFHVACSWSEPWWDCWPAGFGPFEHSLVPMCEGEETATTGEQRKNHHRFYDEGNVEITAKPRREAPSGWQTPWVS